VRPAVARQVVPARGLAGHRVPIDHRALCAVDPGILRGAGAGPAGPDRLLHRRAHRAGTGAPACRALSRADRRGSRRFPAALVRHRLAAPRRRAWRRGVRGAGIRAGGAAIAAGASPRDALAIHAERSRRVPRRSVFLPRRRRPAGAPGRHPHRRLPAVPADRRIRLFVHARRYPAHRRGDCRRAGHHHARSGAFPHEREPAAIPRLPAARTGRHRGPGGPAAPTGDNMKTTPIAALLACLALPAAVQAQETLKIGALVTLSGAGASWGQGMKNAAEIAADQINQAGGLEVGGKKYQVSVVAYDDKYQANEAVTVVNRLVFEDKVRYIIGPVGSAPVLAIQANAEKNGVIVMTLGFTAKALGPEKSYTFRPNVTTAEVSQPQIDWLVKAQGLKKVGALFPND